MKMIPFCIFILFCVSCTQEQYVYENVGTTTPVLVQKKHTKQQIKKTAVKKTIVVEKQQDLSKKPKDLSATLIADNMGTQDSDWMKIGTFTANIQKPKEATHDGNQCSPNGCSTDGNCCQRKKNTQKTQPKMKYYPSRYQRSNSFK